MEADTSCVAGDYGTDLQELEADDGALGAGVFAVLESEPPEGVPQSVGETGKKRRELVRPHQW